MSTRPTVRAVGALALALLLALGAAAPASSAPRPPDLPAELIAAMQRDLGLSATQARDRIAAENAGAVVAEQLQGRLGGAYGDAWWDQAAGRLVVRVRDTAAAAVVRAAGAIAQVVPPPGVEPAAVASDMDVAAADAPDEVTGWYVDPVTATVVVTTTDAAGAAEFIARVGATAGPVRVEVVPERPRLLAGLVGGQAITTAAGDRCSIGFSARSSASSRVAYVLTAGHCTQLGGQWAGPGGAVIGPVSATAFPTDDFGAIRVASTSWTPTSRVAGSASVLGSTVAAVGASVCRSGSTTGYRCGVVRARNQTVNYGGGITVSGLTTTSACAEQGDSGGSFVSGRQAQGLLSGGTGNCTTGGETYFQPVREVLARYRLTLVTG